MAKLFISDERMLYLMDIAIRAGQAENESDYFAKIGFPRTNINALKSGVRGFTKEQILEAAKLTGANVNWIFGLENNITRKEPVSAMDLLREAVAALESSDLRVSQKVSQKPRKTTQNKVLKK